MSVRSDRRTATSRLPRLPQMRFLRRVLPPLLALLALLLLWVASDIAVPAPLTPWTGRLQGFATVFLGIFIEALPFLMAGVLVSSAIHLFVSEERIRRLSPRSPFRAAIMGSLLGMAFPVCECGSIPTARRLISKGAAIPAGIAFALAAPVINPVVLISTYVAFANWEIVAWRAGLTIVIAVLVGWLVGTPDTPDKVLAPAVGGRLGHRTDQFDLDPALAATLGSHQHDDHHHEDDPQASPVRRVLMHANAEFFEMVRYLIIGAMLAATLQTLVPQQALLALGNGPVASVLVMMLLAVVLSICSTVDAFIALSFANTFTPGAILAFLVFGPMIDIKSTLMLTSTFRRRTVAIIVLLCFQLTLLAGVFINLNLS